MNTEDPNKNVDRILEDIYYVIDNVAARGFDDRDEETDDFAKLIQRKEYRDVVVGEFYEAFFVPARHEFDWQIIAQITDLVVESSAVHWAAGTIAAGALYDVTKRVFHGVHNRMKQSKLPDSRFEPYEEAANLIENLRRFFEKTRHARIAEIEKAIDYPREKIYPLMKLLQFKHHRRTYNCMWCEQGTPDPE